ncbi:MAG: transcriptional regulator NrdR [Bacillota bacterium]
MKCPFCGYLDSRVLDTRPTDDGAVIRRRRECPGCDRRFTTYERIEQTPLMVVKKDGRREVFDRSKLLAGMIKACEKRPIALTVLEDAAATVERELRHTGQGEVSSQEVGERIMDKLRAIDEVAYVRFASVYRQFKDVGKFLEELERLLENRER